MNARIRVLLLIIPTILAFACRAATTLVLPPARTTTIQPSTQVTELPTPVQPPTLVPSPTYTPFPTPTSPPPNIEDVLSKCPTAAELASINADLQLIFDNDPTAGMLVCTAAEGSADLSRLQERTYQAILMMKRIQFDKPLPWTEQQLYDWFSGAVDGIRFRSDIEYSFCCDPENIINVQTKNLAALQTNRWVDPQSGTGLQGLMVLFVHEARHNQGYGHTCGVNDNTIGEMGAWGVQYLLLQWLAFHSSPDFVTASDVDPRYYREAARDEATWTYKDRFCAEPTPTSGPPLPVP